MSKTYFQLLKEAVSGENARYDDSYYKGPMIDPILSYDGSGDLRGKKDAATILERFYFSEEDVLDTEKNQDDDSLVKEKDKEEEDKKENEELAESEDESEDLDIDEEELEEDDHSPIDGEDKLEDATGDDLSGTFDEKDDQEITTEAIVIERLIKEMEEESDDEDEEKEDEKEEELEEEDHSPTDGLEKVLDSTGEDDKGTLEESEDNTEDEDEEDEDEDEDEEELEENAAVTNSNKGDLDEKELEEAFKQFEDELKKSLME